MRKFLLIGIAFTYLYIFWLSISLFLIPAFKLYFDMYGIAGTFLIWAGLTAAGWACGYYFAKIYTTSPPTHYIEE